MALYIILGIVAVLGLGAVTLVVCGALAIGGVFGDLLVTAITAR